MAPSSTHHCGQRVFMDIVPPNPFVFLMMICHPPQATPVINGTYTHTQRTKGEKEIKPSTAGEGGGQGKRAGNEGWNSRKTDLNFYFYIENLYNKSKSPCSVIMIGKGG